MPAFRGPDGRVVYVPEEEAGRYRAGGDYQEVGDVAAGAAQNRIAPTDNGVLGSVGATVSSALSGATLGASDWLLKGVLDKGQFEQLAQDRADNPWLSGAGQTVGMIAPALVTGGAATPAGALGRVAAEGIEASRAVGGAAGVAGQLAVAGGEGALQNAGIYLSDVALGDRKLTAEGINGALGTGLLFGAAGVPVMHGIEAGTIAARRMFARYAEGGAQAAGDAAAAWTEKAQKHLDAFDQAADVAQAKLAEAQAAREAAGLRRLRANAEMADARAFTPPQEFPGTPGAAGAAGPEAAAGGAAQPGAAAPAVPAEPPEVAMARALRDRAKALGGEPITPEEIAAVQQQAGAVPGAPGFKREYNIPGARPAEPASVPLMVTQRMKQQLADLGFTAEQVSNMTPKQAWEAINASRPPAVGNALDALAAETGIPAAGPATSVREHGLRAVPVTADEAGLSAALTEYQDARRAFDDLHAQVDPDLDAILRGVQPGEVQRPPVPIGEFGAPGARGFKSQETLARLASGTGREEGMQAAELADVTGAGGPRALRAQGTPVRSLGEVAAEQSPVPVEQPATAVGKRPAAAAAEPAPAIPTYEHLKAQPDAIITTVPSSVIEERGWYEMPGQGADTVKAERGRATMREGQRDPIKITVAKDGKLFIEDGRNRLNAAIEQGAPIKVRWDYGTVSGEGDVFKGGRAAAAAHAEAGDDLLAALSGTKSAIDKGAELVDIGGKEAAATRADQLLRHPDTAERFLAKAGATDAAAAIRGPAPGSDLDQFFADLRAPKTRDAYVAQNIGRAMREEGSHAAALAKVEREWTERTATEAWAERAAVLEYEGGYSRAEAERIARDEVGNAARGPGAESPPVWESKKNPRRVEAAKKAAAASVERLHEIHSAVASNLPEELQTAWNEEGYKFLRDESARIRGMKDRINAASKISEAFTEKYGAASETGRGYEGDRFYRRAEIEAKHAESWANEQERKYYASAARDEHPFDIRRLEMAHDDALERAATAADPAERAAAAQEAQVIEKQITQVGARPGAVEDIAALAPAVTRIEKAAAALTEVLGEAAPTAAKEHAAAFRAAEDEASRKTTARIGQAADDAAAARTAAQNRDPLAPPARAAGDDLVLGPSQKQQRIAAAQKAQREAQAAYAKAQVSEAEAKIGAKQAASAAADARAKLGPPPEAPGPAAGGHGIGERVVQGAHMVGYAAELGSDMGIPGIPRPHDIPVIGPLLSAYLKYRALRAAAGRFVGRVPATAETRAAALAARTRDGVARAVDRSLGLIERNPNTVRVAATVGTMKATDALSKRLVDDGQPDAPAKASLSQQAAVRMREVAAVVANPSLIQAAIRVQGRALTDPDLIDALSGHLMTMFQHLSDVAPKGPPPNPFTGKAWTPSEAEAIRWGQQVAIARDPQVAFQMLEAGTLTPAGAGTLQKCYELLFRDAQQRVIQRAADLKNPVDYSQLLRIGRLFGIPLHPSQDPQHAAALSGAHTPAAKPAPPGGAGGPPTSSIANPTSLSSLYDAGDTRRAGRM